MAGLFESTSADSLFPPRNPVFCWDFFCKSDNIFKAIFGGSFGSRTFDEKLPTGLSHETVLADLSAVGSLAGGGDLGSVDLVYMHELFPGDADRNFTFDQLDIVKVQQDAKYLTGLPATWGEGDWNGGPGGYPGVPPVGNSLFDQNDIVAALQAGTYLIGPYAAIGLGGVLGDSQTSLVYDANTGELKVDAPAGKELTSINITSAGGMFIGNRPRALGDGSFAVDHLLKAAFGGSFGSINLGNILPAGIGEATLAADLSAVGSLAGGGDLGQVDLVYVPEPASCMLAIIGIAALSCRRRWA